MYGSWINLCPGKIERRRLSNEEIIEESFVTDVKSLVRVVVMMLPFPMFWALYDQQVQSVYHSSTPFFILRVLDGQFKQCKWILELWETFISFLIKCKSSMQFSSSSSFHFSKWEYRSFCVLECPLLSQAIVYPLIERVGLRVTMLRKMAAGGLLVALSFVLCALVQLAIQVETIDILPFLISNWDQFIRRI